jgi:hypothetical protein
MTKKYGIDLDDANNEVYEASQELVKQQAAEDWCPTKLLERYEHLRRVTLENIPALWSGLEFALSVKTILNIRGCTIPFCGILLGPASSSKTVIIELFRGYKHTFYTDNFSPKSLVSHLSGLKEEQLRKIDLLPKIKNKLFLTPELAAIFASRDDDLLQVLGILTRVADGQGYESDSGAQGHRGYHEDMMFVWIGAAVDIPYKVHKLLGTLGPKLYFFRLSRVEESEDYYHKNRNENFAEKKQKIRTALLEYLAYFEMNPDIVMEEEYEDDVRIDLPKIALEPDKDVELVDRIIIRLAKLLAHLRAIVPTWETKGTQGSEYAYSLAKVEDPSRAITQLRNLAKGHALSKGRKYITLDDIPIVIHTALSTATIERVRIFELLIANNGTLTTSQIVDFLNTTKPTALKTMTELKATGLVNMVPGDERTQAVISLKAEFDWFLSCQFADLKERKENSPPQEEVMCTQSSLFLYDYTINQKVLSSCGGQNSLRNIKPNLETPLKECGSISVSIAKKRDELHEVTSSYSPLHSNHVKCSSSDTSDASDSITPRLGLKHTQAAVVHTNEDLASENDS